MAATSNEGTSPEGQGPLLPKSEGIGNDGSFVLISKEEGNKYADEYIKRLEQRYLDFEVLVTSGYF